MAGQKICIIGGTGFIGLHLTNRLTALGHSVSVLTRRPERHRELRVGTRLQLVQVNPYDAGTLSEQLRGSDCVINLVGILNEAGNSTFSRAHVELPRTIIKAMRDTGACRLLHMSALNADVNENRSRYLKTKGEGENLVHQSPGVEVTSFRPSVVFGRGDSFFNRFATFLKLTPPPVFPLACAQARFAPVYVGDVVAAFVHALENPASAGRRIELCGPNEYTLKQLVQYTADLTGNKTYVLSLPGFASRLQARLLGMLPVKPFSLDNYYSLQKNSTCSESAFPAMGINPRSVEAIVPRYLGTANSHARYDKYRAQARRAS
ncbi:NAD-dependent epimerase/dehydratase [hydrothermal vent metagenome]|uniref:NAD-dependent epimerase/dehydratase n=1 Tax=hydrothermal vent metagenome TaxID=652676 RepID=A0A3B0Z6N0_9ZZZZ